MLEANCLSIGDGSLALKLLSLQVETDIGNSAIIMVLNTADEDPQQVPHSDWVIIILTEFLISLNKLLE